MKTKIYFLLFLAILGQQKVLLAQSTPSKGVEFIGFPSTITCEQQEFQVQLTFLELWDLGLGTTKATIKNSLLRVVNSNVNQISISDPWNPNQSLNLSSSGYYDVHLSNLTDDDIKVFPYSNTARLYQVTIPFKIAITSKSTGGNLINLNCSAFRYFAGATIVLLDSKSPGNIPFIAATQSVTAELAYPVSFDKVTEQWKDVKIKLNTACCNKPLYIAMSSSSANLFETDNYNFSSNQFLNSPSELTTGITKLSLLNSTTTDDQLSFRLRAKAGIKAKGAKFNLYIVDADNNIIVDLGAHIVDVGNADAENVDVEVSIEEDLDAGTISICEGSSHTFSVKATGATGYQWYKDQSEISDAIGSNYTITNASESDYDTYWVKINGAEGRSVNSQKTNLWVVQNLPATLEFSEIPTEIYPNKTAKVQLKEYPSATQYSWSFSNNNISFDPAVTTINSTTLKAGAIPVSGTLKVTMTHACGDRELEQAIRFTYPTGIDDLEKIQIVLYPNPTNNELHIKSEDIIKSVIIRDISGRLVHNNSNVNNENLSISAGGWANGIYIVTVQTANKTSIRKVIKK